MQFTRLHGYTQSIRIYLITVIITLISLASLALIQPEINQAKAQTQPSQYTPFSINDDDIIPYEYIVSSDKLYLNRGLRQTPVLQDSSRSQKYTKITYTPQSFSTRVAQSPQRLTPKEESQELLTELQSIYGSDNVFHNRRFKTRVSNDPLYQYQWGLENTGQTLQFDVLNTQNEYTLVQGNGTNGVDTNIPDLWSQGGEGEGSVIAVMDSGVDYTHPDIENNIWINQNEIPSTLTSTLDTNSDQIIESSEVLSYLRSNSLDANQDGQINLQDALSINSPISDGADTDGNGYVDDIIGWNFLDNTNSPMDFDGHGTHVAGISGAESRNGIGLTGASSEAKILPLASIGAQTDTITVLNTYTYAGQYSDVINMSWGSSDTRPLSQTTSDPLYTALVDLADNGVISVHAAGNDQTFATLGYPTKSPYVISVGSHNADGSVSSFSNFGPNVDILAPGEGIVSLKSSNALSLFDGNTLNSQYLVLSGTSMSAPFVSSAIAILKANQPTLSFNQIKALVRSQNYNNPSGEFSFYSAFGNFTSDGFIQNPVSTFPLAVFSSPESATNISQNFDITVDLTPTVSIQNPILEYAKVSDLNITPTENWQTIDSGFSFTDFSALNLDSNSYYAFRARGQYQNLPVSDMVVVFTDLIQLDESFEIISNKTNYEIRSKTNTDYSIYTPNVSIVNTTNTAVTAPVSFCWQITTCSNNGFAQLDLSGLSNGLYTIEITLSGVGAPVTFTKEIRVDNRLNDTATLELPDTAGTIQPLIADTNNNGIDEIIFVDFGKGFDRLEYELTNAIEDGYISIYAYENGALLPNYPISVDISQNLVEDVLVHITAKPIITQINNVPHILFSAYFEQLDIYSQIPSPQDIISQSIMYGVNLNTQSVVFETGYNNQSTIPVGYAKNQNNTLVYEDITGDQIPEIITSNSNGGVYIFSQSGALLESIQFGSSLAFSEETYIDSNTVISDISLDGKQDIIHFVNDTVYTAIQTDTGFDIQSIYEITQNADQSHITSLFVTQYPNTNLPIITVSSVESATQNQKPRSFITQLSPQGTVVHSALLPDTTITSEVIAADSEIIFTAIEWIDGAFENKLFTGVFSSPTTFAINQKVVITPQNTILKTATPLVSQTDSTVATNTDVLIASSQTVERYEIYTYSPFYSSNSLLTAYGNVDGDIESELLVAYTGRSTEFHSNQSLIGKSHKNYILVYDTTREGDVTERYYGQNNNTNTFDVQNPFSISIKNEQTSYLQGSQITLILDNYSLYESQISGISLLDQSNTLVQTQATPGQNGSLEIVFTPQTSGQIEYRVVVASDSYPQITNETIFTGELILSVIQNTPPTATIPDQSSNSLNIGDQITITPTITDVEGDYSYTELYVQNTLINSTSDTTPSFTVILSQESTEVYVVVYDTIGNSSQSNTVTYTTQSSSETSSSSQSNSSISSSSSSSQQSISSQSSLSSESSSSSISSTSNSLVSVSSLESSSVQSIESSSSSLSSSIESSIEPVSSTSNSDQSSSSSSSSIVSQSSSISSEGSSESSLDSSIQESTQNQSSNVVISQIEADSCEFAISFAVTAAQSVSGQISTTQTEDIIENAPQTFGVCSLDSVIEDVTSITVTFSLSVDQVGGSDTVYVYYSNSPWQAVEATLLSSQNGVNTYQGVVPSSFRQIGIGVEPIITQTQQKQPLVRTGGNTLLIILSVFLLAIISTIVVLKKV